MANWSWIFTESSRNEFPSNQSPRSTRGLVHPLHPLKGDPSSVSSERNWGFACEWTTGVYVNCIVAMPATYNRVHPGEGADRPISFCRPLDRIAQQLDSAAIHAQLGPWQCLGKCHSTRPELGRTRLNLTVPVRISNRFSPHLRGEGEETRWTAVHRPFAAVPNPISARENFSFDLAESRDSTASFCRARESRGERMDKFLFLFLCGEENERRWYWMDPVSFEEETVDWPWH